jgi:hypothetical protein
MSVALVVVRIISSFLANMDDDGKDGMGGSERERESRVAVVDRGDSPSKTTNERNDPRQ